jgi:hypothetical protein
MAEATSTTVAETTTVAVTPTPKVWSDDQVQEIIRGRNDAKEARRTAEAERDKFKVDAEKAARDAQKYQADLDAERKRTETYGAQEKELREHLVSRIPDGTDKEIATSESLSLKALMKLAEKQITGPAGGRQALGGGVDPGFEEQLKPKPGESSIDYAKRVGNLKRAK